MVGFIVAFVMFMSPSPSKTVMVFESRETITVSVRCPPVCVSRSAQKALKNIMRVHFRSQTQRPGVGF